MRALIFSALIFAFNISDAGTKELVVGKDWVVTVQQTDASLEIHQYFPNENTIEVVVNCTFPDGKVTAKTKTSVRITDSQIINDKVWASRVYSPSGAYWCMAVVAKRVLDYKMLSENHMLISGDPFIPNGSILIGTVK